MLRVLFFLGVIYDLIKSSLGLRNFYNSIIRLNGMIA